MRPRCIHVTAQRENARKYVEGLSIEGIIDLKQLLKSTYMQDKQANNSVSALRWALDRLDGNQDSIRRAELQIKEAEIKLQQARRDLEEARNS